MFRTCDLNTNISVEVFISCVKSIKSVKCSHRLKCTIIAVHTGNWKTYFIDVNETLQKQ